MVSNNKEFASVASGKVRVNGSSLRASEASGKLKTPEVRFPLADDKTPRRLTVGVSRASPAIALALAVLESLAAA